MVYLPNYQTISAQVENEKPNVVFLGASNTVEQISSVSRNGSFITELREYDSWSSVNLVDKAVSGWGVSNYYGELDLVNETLFESSPDYIIIVLGGNDFIRFVHPDTFQIRYNWLIDAIVYLDVNSAVKQIFVADIYWGTLEVDEARSETFQQYQEVIRDASQEYQFPLLDFFTITENHPEYYVDPIHLNDLGHAAIAKEVDHVVAPYFNGSVSRNTDFHSVSSIYINTSVTRDTNYFGFIGIITIITFVFMYRRMGSLRNNTQKVKC